MSRPTLCVVMPNYNHARYLPEAIEGVLGQTRPADEFIILDDASTDESAAIIEKYAGAHPSIRFLRNEKNMGVVEAHRRLFSEARCDYVCTAPADDVHLPRYYELGMQFAETYPQAGIIFGKLRVIDGAGNFLAELGVRRWAVPLYASPEQFLREYLEVEAPSHSLCGGTIYKAAAFREVGWYRAELGSWSDTFAARAIGLKYGACYIPEPVVNWRRHTGSFSDAAREDGGRALELISRAACLMRSPEFHDRFPEAHVSRWAARYRRLVVWNAWIGEGIPIEPARPAFWRRMLRRLPALPRALALLWYQPDAEQNPGG